MGAGTPKRKPPAVQTPGKAGNGDRVRESRARYAGSPLAKRPEASRLEGTKEPLKYVVLFEHTARSVGAYVPDLPGCVAVGGSRREAERLIHEAIAFHIEGMRLEGQLVPEPSASAALVEAE